MMCARPRGAIIGIDGGGSAGFGLSTIEQRDGTPILGRTILIDVAHPKAGERNIARTVFGAKHRRPRKRWPHAIYVLVAVWVAVALIVAAKCGGWW